MSFWNEDNRKKIGNCIFYVALTIELLLMLVERSEIVFSLESYVFRVTFLLLLVAVLVVKHDLKEWIGILVILGFTFFCYRLSGKNELLRLATFLLATRDIDVRKAMKYSFYVCVAGFGLIGLLSVFGIMGDIAIVADFGRGIPDEKRYVFGFGHPNSMFGCIYALMLMWLWLYGKSAKWWGYVIAAGLLGLVIWVTRSRTGLIIVVATMGLAVLARLFKKLSGSAVIYWLGFIYSTGLSVVLTIMAAWKADQIYRPEGVVDDKKFWALDDRIGNRISNLYYGAEDRGAVLSRWKLFAGHESESYFDMGWARLFYWYGIIPTVLIILCIIAILYVGYKKKDIWTLIMVMSLSIYTLAEATFVSRYFGRLFFLLVAGVYLWYFFGKKGEADDGQA